MNHFISHLTELKRFDKSLVESIIHKHNSIFESDNTDTDEKTITVKCRDRENHLRDILNFLSKNKLSGNLIVDSESEKPTLIRIFGVRDGESIKIDRTEDDGEVTFTITVISKMDSRLDTIKSTINAFGDYGNAGHSYESQFVPIGRGNIKIFGWDGDGADFVDTKSL